MIRAEPVFLHIAPIAAIEVDECLLSAEERNRTEQYQNMFKAGVIDPTKVSRVALENAASIAGMLLTTECVIADKPKKEEGHSHGAPDMGGMGGY